MSLQNLKKSAKEMTTLLALMDTREKGDFSSLVKKGEVVTIREFGLVDLKNGEPPFMAFTCDEYEGFFFFGGSVLTENLTELQGLGHEEEIKKNGLPTLFGKKASKSNPTQSYTTVKFFPDEDK